MPSTDTAVTLPTRVRYLIVAVATLSAVLLYLDRICASFVAESIRVEFGASQEHMGWFLSAFFWSYALGQVPAGWLSDRYGIRLTLTWYILVWSAFTALMGLANGIGMLLLCRLGLGLGQAGAYPGCARAVRDWMPLEQRGLASSVVAFGGRAGGAIAPVLTGAVMLGIALWQASPDIQPHEVIHQTALVKWFDSEDPATPAWRVALGQQVSISIEDDELLKQMNASNPLQILKSTAAEVRATLPPELQSRVEAYDHGSASDLAPLSRRQFWELACPGLIRKLEARGWRPVLVLYGVAGIAVAAAFWLMFRNTPAEHPRCNVAEHVLIAGETATTTETMHEADTVFPWHAILTSLGLWGNSLCQFATNVGWVFLVTWLPRYLDEVHKVPVLERGVLASIPIFAGMLGMLLGGPWTDRLTKTVGLKYSRRIPIASSRIMAIGGYIICLLATAGWFGPLGTRLPAWIAIGGLAFVAIATDLGVAATWAYAQDVAGRHTAAVVGWANMWGNLGAAVTPILSSQLLGEAPSLDEWNLVFGVCIAAFALSALGGWTMDASRPLVRD
jgi:MFS transporter, ACS family, glucarate transporter